MSQVLDHPLVVVVGSGGVGKTTVAASLGLNAARHGHDTLVMTFDPSLRLKDALGVGDAARDEEVPVAYEAAGKLAASLLDARQTFDRLIETYAPDDESRDRILENRFYDQLSGSLAGILEYMAVERLFEVAQSGRYQRIVLDTPPTRQALDFLEAPDRILSFLDSGVVKIAQRRWFDTGGRLRPTAAFGPLGSKVDKYLDEVVGMDLLRDVADFFRAFGPLYEGFRERAHQVKKLLADPQTLFVLVAGPGEERIPDALFFARRLDEAGYRLGPLVVNRMHPEPPAEATISVETTLTDFTDGRALLTWLGARDYAGFKALQQLMPPEQTLIQLPLLAKEPTDLNALESIGRSIEAALNKGAGLV